MDCRRGKRGTRKQGDGRGKGEAGINEVSWGCVQIRHMGDRTFATRDVVGVVEGKGKEGR